MTTLLDQAANPQLSTRRLRVLVEHDAFDVRAAVASNPSTPCESLLRLLGEFPLEVLENPAMVLYQLANPAVFLQADPDLQADWVRHPATPAWLLEHLGASDDLAVRAGLACHPSSPPALVERLAFPGDFGDEESEPCADVMHHPGLTPGLRFDIALAFAACADPEFDDAPPDDLLELLLLDAADREFIVADDTPSSDVWSAALPADDEDDAADDEGWATRVHCRLGDGVIVQAHCDGEVYGAVRDPDDEDRDADPADAWFDGDDLATIWGMSPAELACHPGAPWHLVRRSLARSDGALDDALGRRDVPAEHLAWLATTASPAVRRAVAAHPATPAPVLSALARAPEPMIRLTVARHLATPPHALDLLADDESAAIRSAVAANRSTPGQVRRRLAEDRRESVRRAAGSEQEDGDE